MTEQLFKELINWKKEYNFFPVFFVNEKSKDLKYLTDEQFNTLRSHHPTKNQHYSPLSTH
jgi:hypothetical protein